MNRRRFFEAMLAAAATPTTYVFFGSLWKPQPQTFLILPEWAQAEVGPPVYIANRLAYIGPGDDCHYRSVQEWESAQPGDLTKLPGPVIGELV